jgi:hypothetical protein
MYEEGKVPQFKQFNQKVPEGFITVEGDGKDCFIVYYPSGKTITIPNCDVLKLANTLFNRSGEKYSEEQMAKWGFELKGVI